jgi:hypothetical protein
VDYAILAIVAFIAAVECWRLWVSTRSRSPFQRLLDGVFEEAPQDEWVAVGHSWSSYRKAKTLTVEFQDRESWERERAS